MEHDPLASARGAASKNLAATYLALGRATGAGVEHAKGFIACTGSVAHPVGNFALRLDLDAAGASQLAELAMQRPTFHVYACPDDQPDSLASVLAAAGFRLGYRLRQMAASRAPDGETCVLVRCTLEERPDTAAFMMREFFGRGGSDTRDAVRAATVTAEELELYRVEDAGKPIGAAMLSRSEGALGLYNLCVRSDKRGRGWGAAIVRAVMREAVADGTLVTLQCDPTLERWYEALGFITLGSVDVYVWDHTLQLL